MTDLEEPEGQPGPVATEAAAIPADAVLATLGTTSLRALARAALPAQAAKTWIASAGAQRLRDVLAALRDGRPWEVPAGQTDTLAASAAASAAAGAVPAEFSALLGAAAAEAFRGRIGGIVADAVADALAARPPLIVARARDGERKVVAGAHPALATLLAYVGAGIDVWIAGPPGSGKSHGAAQCAESLGMAFFFSALSEQSGPADLFGYRDATGRYVSTIFRQAWEGGGLWLLDDVDRANPNTLAALNGALANGIASFPDAMVRRHPDLVVLASANTWGKASREYATAAQDGALMDRFQKLHWDYDAAHETSLARAICPAHGAEVAKHVQACRAALAADGFRDPLLTPRSSMRGARMVELAGWTVQRAMEAVLTGAPPEARECLKKRGAWTVPAGGAS